MPERLVELPLFHPMPNRIQHRIDRHLRHIRRPSPFPKHPRPHQNTIPGRIPRLSTLIELIRAANVTLRGIPHKVHRIRRTINPVRIFPPLPQQSRRELKPSSLWLPERDRPQFLSRDGFEHGLQTRAQGAHADAGETVVSSPDDVVMREEDRRTLVEVLRAGARGYVRSCSCAGRGRSAGLRPSRGSRQRRRWLRCRPRRSYAGGTQRVPHLSACGTGSCPCCP